MGSFDHRSIYLQIVKVLTDTILAKQSDALAKPHANAFKFLRTGSRRDQS